MIAQFLNKAKSALNAAADAIPSQPIKEQANAIQETKKSVDTELIKAEKLATQLKKEAEFKERMGKTINFLNKTTKKFEKGTNQCGRILGSVAKLAVVSTQPLINGVREGYNS